MVYGQVAKRAAPKEYIRIAELGPDSLCPPIVTFVGKGEWGGVRNLILFK